MKVKFITRRHSHKQPKTETFSAIIPVCTVVSMCITSTLNVHINRAHRLLNSDTNTLRLINVYDYLNIVTTPISIIRERET